MIHLFLLTVDSLHKISAEHCYFFPACPLAFRFQKQNLDIPAPFFTPPFIFKTKFKMNLQLTTGNPLVPTVSNMPYKQSTGKHHPIIQSGTKQMGVHLNPRP
jgi:hypothetical protein